jgi:stearoyl-CoA desaturase (delta-9 desaturase)
MFDSFLSFLDRGLLGLSLWQYVLIALVAVQITIASVTIFLHRHQAHRGLDLHPVASHFFRFWLWLTTGMVTKQWVAVHRRHHAKCETEEDPHSPVVEGIGKLVFDGVAFYRKAAADPDTLSRYGHGTPDDWLERRIYTPHKYLGIGLLLVLDLALFGAVGLTIWAVQMMWIPFWAAGVINGLGHWWGYRNYESEDASTNLSPLAIWIGGEELHNNHHAFPSSAKFSTKWWEFDIGWLYIRVLAALGLAKVKKVAPRPRIAADKQRVDLDTLRAVIAARLHVTANYAKHVIRPVLKEALTEAGSHLPRFRKARALLVRAQSRMDAKAEGELQEVLSRNRQLQVVYSFRLRLQDVWGRAASSHEALVQALKEWCSQAEASGIHALQDFARSLQGFSLKGA